MCSWQHLCMRGKLAAPSPLAPAGSSGAVRSWFWECLELLQEMLSQGLTWADRTYFIQVTFTPITDTALCTGSTFAPGSHTRTRLSEKSCVANTSLLITLLPPQLFLVRDLLLLTRALRGGDPMASVKAPEMPSALMPVRKKPQAASSHKY